MPVSGNEEVGVKPSVGQFSEYTAGIPIKKRRFPFILSPSQSAENLPSLPTENELEQKGFSSLLRGSTVSTDTIVAASSDPTDVLLSSHTSGVLSSSNASDIAGSSKTNVIKADGFTASLDSGSFVATSNASGVATSYTSVATCSNASGVSMNSTTISAAAGSVAASSSASSVAMSSTSVSVEAGLNADNVAESFNASSVAMGSTAISVTAGLIADRAVENPTASSVAGSVLGSVSSCSEASEKFVLDKEKSASDDTNGSMVQGNTNLLSVKVEEQSFAVHSRSLVDINRKGRLMATGASENTPRISAKLELDLVSNDSLTINMGKDTYSQKNVDGTLGSQLPEVPGNPGLSLGLGDYLSATASANNEQGFQNQEKEEPVPLNLSLSKADCIAELKSTEVQTNTKGANMLANRTNWDLNMTMDSWEGPGDDGTSKMTNHMDDIKPVICSAGMAAASMPAQQQIREEIERRAKIEMLWVPSSQQYRSEDSLCLGLATPYLHLNPNEILSGSSAKVVSGEVAANISSTGKPVPACKSNMVNYNPVKSEPHDESARGVSAGISEPMVLSSIAQVMSEKNEKLSSETLKSSTLSTLNSVNSMSVKPEPVCESSKKTQERMDGKMNQSDEQMLAKETETVDDGRVASKIIYSTGLDVNESNVSGTLDNSTSHSTKVEDPDHCRLKSMDVQLPDSRGLVEGSASDEEKINLLGDVLEEESYGSDYELDDEQELAVVVGIDHDRREEDDFEDGEVREPVENPRIEVPICEKKETGNGNNGETAFKDFVDPSSSSFGEKDLREDPGLTEPSTVEMPSSQVDKKRPIKALPRKLPNVSVKDTVKGQEGEQTSIQFSDTSQGTSATIAQGADAARSSEGKIKSILPKLEAFSNVDDAGKDVDNGGRNRIINLPRASNLSSPGRTRSISGRALQSQVGRERLPDVALEGDKLHPRGRDEACADSSHRFPRERDHVHPSRNNRMNFMCGRGRISSRIVTLHGDQDSDCNFAGPTEFRIVRNKYASAVSDADLNFSGYNNGKDVAYFGTGRGGRKILNDSSIFPQLPPRRRSPGGRDGPAVRGLQMVRRIPRNLSPSRCIGEDGSEIVGLRHMRGFADDDHTNPMFARCQPSFDGLDGPFVRGNREFTTVQRRGLQRTCSKSPTRPRTRSPSPWSSLRRRSPDGFGGPLELPLRRSPPIYRMERIRSPDRPCFNGDMGIRRHKSPSYLSRPSKDLRDIDPDRDHGHPRSGISNRSLSGRVLLRNRRLDLDPRERNDGDDYFGGPMQSGRFHEIGNDGNGEERRRYADRRGPVRPFRAPYSVTDSENFHLNTEGGPRSFRFCPEDDSELHERGTVREREFDRRIKKRSGNAPPRRARNIEDHEGNFRHGGQNWQDDGIEDVSQVKRKRF
ncbi:uncharacterized protein LOC120193117 isoform X2 [Hibiscus syriacus]|uniref:uncharacterized protein LOC120193117 isoform X2 n=1 Tax=Hibiscus syriacus TaxID=106335 RepID=UPI001924944B|nr:uncharacterized protein LOC120193117 isoform X2 [Hibiscus syriacus]